MASYAFGPFTLDTGERTLSRSGRPVPLPRKAYETLAVLVERAGRVVEKAELMGAVWPDAFVEESNLAQSVFRLRKTLGDGRGRQRYIETVPGRGYRFVARVEAVAPREGHASAAAAPGEIDSLAVLPLTNEGGDPDLEYLADGITEGLLGALSQLPGIRVMARSTVFSLRGLAAADPVAAGRKVGVRAVLTGSVSQAGARLVVKAELVDTADGARLWGAEYGRPSADVFEVEAEIARAVSERLGRGPTPPPARGQAVRRHTGSEAAYLLYLKGRHYWNRRLAEDLGRAISYFQQAIDEDPTFALAYVGMADCYDQLCGISALPPGEGYPRAKAAVLKALELDPELAEAHASLAHLHMRYDWDWAAAGREFLRALALNPNYAVARHWHAIYLTIMGRHDEALAEGRAAQRLDPLSPVIGLYVGGHLFFARRYEEALRHFQNMAKSEFGRAYAHTFLAQAYGQTGRFEEAAAALDAARGVSGEKEDTAILLIEGYLHALAGRELEARAVLEEVGRRAESEFVSPFETAQIHAGLGETDEALGWLEKSFGARECNMIFINVTPEFDRLRGHPRFTRLLEGLGFAGGGHPSQAG